MLESFRALGVKPKADTPEDLKNWLATAGGRATDPVPAVPLSHRPYFPKLSMFSGGPKDTEYDLWKYEVEGLKADRLCSDEHVLQAIRRSVRGEAARTLVRMGHTVTVESVLAKFDACFGLVQEGQSVLAEFYSSKQAVGESVSVLPTDWKISQAEPFNLARWTRLPGMRC